MAVARSKNSVITREDLLDIAEVRLREAEELLARGYFAGAMFMGGCSLECYLKSTICHTLKLSGLPAIFKLHDLDELFLYSGLDAQLRGENNRTIKQSFDIILDRWKIDGRESLLYCAPTKRKEGDARKFLTALNDPKVGVIPWLQKMTS